MEKIRIRIRIRIRLYLFHCYNGYSLYECDEIWFVNTRKEKSCWRSILATKYSKMSIKDKGYTKLKVKVQHHSVELIKTHQTNKMNNKTFDGESRINEEVKTIKIT